MAPVMQTTPAGALTIGRRRALSASPQNIQIFSVAMSFDEQLRVVFSSVLGIDASTLTDDDSPQTIAEWDSLTHLNLIFAVESEFGVRFEAEEIPELMSVEAMRERITREINGTQYL